MFKFHKNFDTAVRLGQQALREEQIHTKYPSQIPMPPGHGAYSTWFKEDKKTVKFATLLDQDDLDYLKQARRQYAQANAG